MKPGALAHRAGRRAWLRLAAASALWPLAAPGDASAGFDRSHAAWDTLLRRYVHWSADGNASRVDYRGLGADHPALRAYLRQLSAVDAATYALWSRPEQLAFLINAYNAFTLELILGAYPNLTSIRDLGSWLQSPWKKTFFELLGQPRSLDGVEHGLIRAPGSFDEPRIHFVVVCASIGCPALRPEALTGARLDAQLDDSMKRFLSDRLRNRYDRSDHTLAVSRIFDWYRGDFSKGHHGFDRVEDVFARHADALADAPEDRQRIRERTVPLRFLDYDWRLNDLDRP